MDWYEDLPRWVRKTIDQAAHFGAGFLLGAINPILSVAVAVGREVWQNWGDEDNDYLDMALDVFVWTLGAVAASLVF